MTQTRSAATGLWLKLALACYLGIGLVSSMAAVETGLQTAMDSNQTLRPGPRKCFLPAVEGMCRAFMPKMYYDAETGGCRWFVYGGCGGNVNRFVDQDDCCESCGDAPFRNGSELQGFEGCIARSDHRTAAEYAESLRTANPPFLGR